MSTPSSVPGMAILTFTFRPSKYSLSAASDCPWARAGASRRRSATNGRVGIVASAVLGIDLPHELHTVYRILYYVSIFAETTMIARTPLRDEVYRQIVDRVQ